MFMRFLINLAEREGFEPPIPVKVCRFSRPLPSTTRPPLQPYYYAPSAGFLRGAGPNGVGFAQKDWDGDRAQETSTHDLVARSRPRNSMLCQAIENILQRERRGT